MRKFAFEFWHESKFNRLHLVVFKTFFGATVHGLFAVEQVRRRIPYITHIVDTELVGSVSFGYEDVAFVGRFTQLQVAYACVFQNLLHLFFVLVADLDNNTRIFCKQNLDNILFLHLVEADFHTAFHIGEAHFEQCSDQTTGRNIMSGKNQSFVYQFLYGKESIAEILCVLYARHIVTHFAQ